MNINQAIELANNFQNEGKLDQAEHIYKELLKLLPNNASIYYNLGIIFQDKVQLDDAMTYYMKALQLNPSLVDAYYNLGTVLRDQGRIEDAKTFYQKTIQLDPKNIDSYISISQMARLEGQRFAAAKLFSSQQWSLDTMVIQVDNDNKLLYLEIPKAGTTSIKRELFLKSLFGKSSPEEINSLTHIILGYQYATSLAPYKNYFKFTVVRDPYTRFMSAYFFGINKKHRKKYDLLHLLGIENWPDEILNDPNQFIENIDKEILNKDPHTALQTHLLPKDLNELDYIGQLEKIEELGKKISNLANDNINFNLTHFKKGFIQDYYSFKIDAGKFNQIFMEDYETLNKFYKPLTNSLFSGF